MSSAFFLQKRSPRGSPSRLLQDLTLSLLFSIVGGWYLPLSTGSGLQPPSQAEAARLRGPSDCQPVSCHPWGYGSVVGTAVLPEPSPCPLAHRPTAPPEACAPAAAQGRGHRWMLRPCSRMVPEAFTHCLGLAHHSSAGDPHVYISRLIPWGHEVGMSSWLFTTLRGLYHGPPQRPWRDPSCAWRGATCSPHLASLTLGL